MKAPIEKCNTSTTKESQCLRGLLIKEEMHMPNIKVVKYEKNIFIGLRIARYTIRSFLEASENFCFVIIGNDPILALNNFAL